MTLSASLLDTLLGALSDATLVLELTDPGQDP